MQEYIDALELAGNQAGLLAIYASAHNNNLEARRYKRDEKYFRDLSIKLRSNING